MSFYFFSFSNVRTTSVIYVISFSYELIKDAHQEETSNRDDRISIEYVYKLPWSTMNEIRLSVRNKCSVGIYINLRNPLVTWEFCSSLQLTCCWFAKSKSTYNSASCRASFGLWNWECYHSGSFHLADWIFETLFIASALYSELEDRIKIRRNFLNSWGFCCSFSWEIWIWDWF
jgi:hypothetical protein